MRNRFYVLAFLLIVISFAAYLYVLPRFAPPNPALAPDQVVNNRPKPLSTSSPLADGSFNILPPAKSKPADDPTTLILSNAWRARYKPFLDKALPSPGSPGFYVYSFLDRTPEGVGNQFTYGWHLVGTAALAALTNARLAGSNPPEHYGLPLIDEDTTAPLRPPTADEWTSRALADPATADARYVIVGAYDYSPETKQYSLTIRLADRQNPGQTKILCDGQDAERGDFPGLAAEQRRVTRRMVDSLIESGLIQPRRSPDGQLPSLQGELAQIACMLDSNDSWSIMDGIDQALALQLLYPTETTPLQAAAYGLNLLQYSHYHAYGWVNRYGTGLTLAAYALSQVALIKNPDTSLAQLNWICANRFMGLPWKLLATAVTGSDVTRAHPELEVYRRFVMDEFQGDLTDEQMAVNPDWLVLWLEYRQTDNDHAIHQGRPYFNQRVNAWPVRDSFLYALIRNSVDDTCDGEKLGPDKYIHASVTVMQATIAQELTAILLAQREGLDRERACGEIAVLIGGDKTELLNAANGDSVYRLRDCLLRCLKKNWTKPPDNLRHPCYKTLEWMQRQADAIQNDPRWATPLNGFAGFEFTPAERVRFAQNHDHVGPILAAVHQDQILNAQQAAADICQAHLSVRPTNAMAHLDAANFLDRRPGQNDLAPQRAEHVAENRLFPLDCMSYYQIGRCDLCLEHQASGLGAIREFIRQTPFSIDKSIVLAELFHRRGYHALAVENCKDALREMPRRDDLEIVRAWSLCEMGRGQDPEIRETFARALKVQAENPTFHVENLNYLYNWAHDVDAARDAAASFRRAFPHNQDAFDWQFKIERETGNTTKALQLLQGFNTPNENKAEYYGYMCRYYVQMNKLDVADQYLKKAVMIHGAKVPVVESAAELALARGDYKAAIQRYQFLIDVYGRSSGCAIGIADCYDKMGDTGKAVGLLEASVFSTPRSAGSAPLIPRLMLFYAKTGEMEKSRQAMEILIHSTLRTRRDIAEALESYKKLHPREAAEIMKNIDEIMSGPKSLW